MEDENYEFPPVQLLSEGERKANKGGKKAVTDTATKLQKHYIVLGYLQKLKMYRLGLLLQDMN